MSSKVENENKFAAWDPQEPFQELPPLPPAIEVLESKAVLKKCIVARSALAELKQAANLLPNQTVLINVLPLLEARASSEIENIVTTTDRLFQFSQSEEKADPATKEAIRYSRALLEGYRSRADHPLNTRTAEEVCGIIKGKEMSVRRVPGTQLINDKTGAVIYTPPTGEKELRDLLFNWERFLHEQKELDPLVRMAVGHYQFEAIHPFTDGNGRTGRILNSLYLIEEDLLTLPILYLSRYLIQQKQNYYRLLLGVTTDQAWEEWVLFVLTGIEDTSKWTCAKIDGIRRLMDHTKDYIKAHAPKIYSHELVSVIFELPYCRILNLTQKKIVERQAASRYLKTLAKLGVLREVSEGRDKIFIHPKMMNLLSDDTNKFDPY